MRTSPVAGRHIEVEGIVQGVGFRPWVWRLARAWSLTGGVRNDAKGVTIEAFGDEDDLDAFLGALRHEAPPAARIRRLDARPIAPEAHVEFVIGGSDAAGERRVSIPPDLAACPECLSEVADPADRRYAYPFTNCTQCGPRFTIATGVPYDRGATTMAGFRMCAACRAEYEAPGDRRHHAQPNACPACGPHLVAVRPDGTDVDDALEAAAGALAAGRIVAVKGLGGFHLACDATSANAVRRLRDRKRRDEKPLAVMVADLSAAEALAVVTGAERALLTAVERPIVLLRRRADAPLAPEIAPDSPLVGLMIAYSPLHRLLLERAGRPLVMTSGNLADEPMAIENDEALRRLGGIADLFLFHDRPIAARCDDSVATVVAGAPVLLRRSRGYVPRAITLPRPVSRPILACGAHLKNTFCVAAGDQAWLGPHVGDLDTVEAGRAFEEAVERMLRYLDVRPEVVAHDLHPDYFTTAYAERRREPRVAVQHHHAHVASAMAEHGLTGPVVGVAFDGTGYGSDGAAWGGEFLWATPSGFERVATLRPLTLAGGSAALREVWRLAAALVDDALGPEAVLHHLPPFAVVPPGDLAAVRMLARSPRAVRAHGAGRYFDAVGSLVLGRVRSAFEGQVALAWNAAADPREVGAYPFAIDRRATPWQVDFRPMTRAVLEDLGAGVPAGLISARFHGALALAIAEVVRGVMRERAHVPVVLTGGCFANALLAERTLVALGADVDARLHGDVPPGDGGIALGQALVADEVTRAEGAPKMAPSIAKE